MIFGVTLPLGKPFPAACLGGAVGGALISYWKVATVITFGISGLPLALTIVTGKVMLYLLGYLVAVIAGFLFTGCWDSTTQRSKVWPVTSVALSFDLDGTLHQQDMFGTFMRYLLRRQPLTRCWYYPVTRYWHRAAGEGRAARWPMSLLLWGCTFGHSEARLKQLEQDFAHWFRGHVAAFPVVQARLTSYLDANDADIWLITGSPQTLVEQVYFDTPGCRA